MDHLDIKIGVIGLGDMGAPIAKNLLNAGYTVYGCDTDKSKLDVFASAGGLPCGSACELAGNSGAVLTALPSSEAFIKMAASLEDALAPGKYLVEMGTTVVHEMRRICAGFRDKGVAVLDAPMSGGPIGVERKQLQVFVGGDRAAFDFLRPVFAAYGGEGQIFYCGESGFGQVAKGVNQLSLGLFSAAAVEILAYAKNENLDFGILREMFAKKFPMLEWPLNSIEKGGHPGVKFRELPYYIENAEKEGYNLPITKEVYDFMAGGDFIAFDDHRKAPSYYHELTKDR